MLQSDQGQPPVRGHARREALRRIAFGAAALASGAAMPTIASAAHPGPNGHTVVGSAAFQGAYKESPLLADLVKAGKLPAVERRLPENPRVIKPLEATGKYGGTWRRAYRGPSDRVGPTKLVEEMLIDWMFREFCSSPDFRNRKAEAERLIRTGNADVFTVFSQLTVKNN